MAEAKHLRTVDRPIAYGHWIAGRDVASAATFSSYNPTTGAVWGTFALGSRDEVGAAVAAAKAAFETLLRSRSYFSGGAYGYHADPKRLVRRRRGLGDCEAFDRSKSLGNLGSAVPEITR